MRAVTAERARMNVLFDALRKIIKIVGGLEKCRRNLMFIAGSLKLML